MVRAMGADHVIDYRREDFTQGEPRYDFILDNVGNHSLSDTRRALTASGTLLPNGGGHSGGGMATIIKATVSSLVNRQQARPSIKFQNSGDLPALPKPLPPATLPPALHPRPPPPPHPPAALP